MVWWYHTIPTTTINTQGIMIVLHGVGVGVRREEDDEVVESPLVR